MPRSHARNLLILAALAAVTYLPALQLPLIEDDYPNITQAEVYGPSEGWPEMMNNPIFRYRATSYVLLYHLYNLFDINPLVFHLASITLHLAGAWLLYALGVWKPLGFRLSFFGAAFFAVYEGHQEAVMWASACNELLAFVFGIVSLLGWICFLEGKKKTVWYVVSLAAFPAALISKESAVVFAGLLFLPVAFGAQRRLRDALFLLPFLAMALISVAMIVGTRDYSFRFQDGSFSLRAPFWLTLPNSFARLFWIWGLVGAVILLALKAVSRWRSVLAISLVWIVLALIPYSFLTYSTRIPSRQTYLASAGLAWIIGAAYLEVVRRWGPFRGVVPIAVCLAVLAHNIGYVWTKKYEQFRQRAEPTEQLIALARRVNGPIYVRCFPRPRLVAEEAVRLGAGRPREQLVWDENDLRNRPAAAVFCYREAGSAGK